MTADCHFTSSSSRHTSSPALSTHKRGLMENWISGNAEELAPGKSLANATLPSSCAAKNKPDATEVAVKRLSTGPSEMVYPSNENRDHFIVVN